MDEPTDSPTPPTHTEPTTGHAVAAHSDVAQVRREQILDAAEAVISGEGIHRLSLGRIEEKVGRMSRGQLTYYFPTKESILLAVFERMLRRMLTQAIRGDGPKPMTGQAWECLTFGLTRHLMVTEPRTEEVQFISLLYTFLAQMNHRDDYRAKLREVYGEWRGMVASDIVGSVPAPQTVSPRVVASLVQALFHGLGMQLAVDPDAFDRHEMLAACLGLMAPLFHQLPPESSGIPRV